MKTDWDYLILTASNERQAESYEHQLTLRRDLGFVSRCRSVLVIPDVDGKRIGSGGSTLYCLAQVLARELPSRNTYVGHPQLWRETLETLRILIVHAGGDSRRLPSYSPCGKIFVPVPGESTSCLPMTLFDRQLPTYLNLPGPKDGGGQVVITSGDVLLHFDPTRVTFQPTGMTGLACYASPGQARRHGVFCAGSDGRVRLFLQKPSPAEQDSVGAVDGYGRAALDIGVTSLTADTAVRLLEVFGVQVAKGAQFTLQKELGEGILKYGLDFYREICCALGDEATRTQYIRSTSKSGSRCDERMLNLIFESVRDVPLYVDVLGSCEFLHFGTSAQLISNGNYLAQSENKRPIANTILSLNTELVGQEAKIAGSDAWVEGCSIRSRVDLAGRNLLVGVDVDEPVSLTEGVCVDVVPGQTRTGKRVWFVRIYGIDDKFDRVTEDDAAYLGMPLAEWLEAVEVAKEEIWPNARSADQRTLWQAKLFPSVAEPGEYRKWLWMADPGEARQAQREAWRETDRYCLAEMAELADISTFHQRRQRIHAAHLLSRLGRAFGLDSEFSASEVAYILREAQDAQVFVVTLVAAARLWHENGRSCGVDCLIFPRVIHTLGTAIKQIDSADRRSANRLLSSVSKRLSRADRQWLESLGLTIPHPQGASGFATRATTIAFDCMGKTILSSSGAALICPRAKLRSDEIVWGRASARLDTGGGWTDTPPYALENGGCVVNTAVDLNGQPPIQAYLRLIDEPVIRIGSIDLGTRIEIDALDDLLDYRQPDSEYGLAKAALALSGFSPEAAPWPYGIDLRRMLELFGGGIELSTLAAVPKGSGLGTSSIMGAVLLAVIGRAMGLQYSHREILHGVLRLEQSLTTGGGWQDQVGGVVGGAKIISTEPGLLPDARIEYLLPDVLDPTANGGQTLLFYTGITRLAKDILGQVVGHYLDRDRRTMATLRQIRALAPRVAEAMSRKDIRDFGELVHVAWELNKQLDPGSTNDHVENLMGRISPYVHGAKLLGAGGGGFLLMVCRSPEHAGKVRQMLEKEPPNDRARFFSYQINRSGLVVTAC